MNKAYSRIDWKNEPSILTPLNELNLNKMDLALDTIDDRVVAMDTTKADESEVQQLLEDVTYNSTTGVFEFTWKNGNTLSVDLNIEKIPVSFSMSPQGVITMTTADGTTYTADVASLIKTYSFADSSEVDFTVTTDSSGNKTVTASIVEGSITANKLQPNFLADCEAAKDEAEIAAGNASGSAINSELSSEDSEAWAVGERNGQPVPSTDPAYENNAKYWAQHGSNSFAGLTDTDFTNLQNGQIAKYNDTTQKWENANESGGGLLPHLYIDSEAGSTVTVVAPDSSVITPTQISSGHWECDVPSYGVYTIHAVLNGDDAVLSLTVDDVKEYHVTDSHYSYTLNVYAPTGSTIRVTATGETYTGTGAGSTAVVFALHQASTTYTITVTYDGLDIDTTITSSATTGGSGSKTITFGTINLTVDEDLIGETIVMAKGTDTVSKVASSTSMVFYPNATGNWRISAEYEGETVYAEPDPIVVSSLSTPVSAELSLVKIPEGATVLPTDDIQTWLACAGITDKSYTTLAEVLADSTTLLALMSNNNAVDYLVRSKSWAGSSEGLVPKMTSDTQPSGECFSSYDNSNAYKVFDKDDTSAFMGSTSTATQSFGYDFGEPVYVNKATHLSQSAYGTTNPKIKLQYSDDKSTWQDASEPVSFGASANVLTTIIGNINTPHRYWRVYLYGDSGSSSWNTYTVQFYCTGIVTDANAMTDIGANNYCANTLLSDSTWAEAICNSTYFESVLNTKVPTMTSNTTPSGTCIRSSVYSSSAEAFKAFDNNTSTWWNANGGAGQWVGYTFTQPVVVHKLYLNNTIGVNKVGTIKVQASNDGFVSDINDVSSNFTPSSFPYNLVLENDTAYTSYRIINISGTSDFNMHEMQFYGRADV